MRILIVSDAWLPQVNGVVRTLMATRDQLTAMGHEVALITPDLYPSVPCPTYPEIRLAMTRPKTVGERIKAFQPDAIHLSTEGPLCLAARRWCLKRAYFSRELETTLRPHHYQAVTAPIRSWIFTDDPIATPNTARDLLTVYPSAPSEISVHAPADFGARRIGHEGAFRKGMEPLWDRIFHWLDNGDA